MTVQNPYSLIGDEFNERKAIAKKMYRDLEKKLADKKGAVEGGVTSS